MTEEALNGIIRYTSENRVTLNQKLKEKVYGYTIDASKMAVLRFEVYEAGRINKHGLIWEKVYALPSSTCYAVVLKGYQDTGLNENHLRNACLATEKMIS